MSVYEKLALVQNELNCPKSRRNTFGNYNYRNCEDILEGVKPIAAKHNAVVLVGDEIQQVGERYYIKATARFVDCESGDVLENTAVAREEESKKGMDGSQITGTASSYARKYALNGLLAIDDVRDADTDENHNERESRADRAKDKSKQENQPRDDTGEERESLRKTILGLGRIKAKSDGTDAGNAEADERTRKFAERIYPDFQFAELTTEQLANVKVRLAKQ